MHRNDLLTKLSNYHPDNKTEDDFKSSFVTFIKTNPDCFERSLEQGHITGSAWIINQTNSKALLTHHSKLDRWLQLGGHADGESDIVKVATTEAHEESGLSSLRLVSSDIFDLDIHTIPARKNEPEHLHYDVRVLIRADENEAFKISNESKDLAWITFERLNEMTNSNESIHRMMLKCMSS